MTFSLQSLFPIIAAACTAVIVYDLLSWLFNRRPSSNKLLRDFGPPQADASVAKARVGSQEHKIRMAFAGYGFDVSGRELLSLYLAIGILGLGIAIVVAAFGMPPLFWLAGPAIAYFCVSSLVTSKWKGQQSNYSRILAYRGGLLLGVPHLGRAPGDLARDIGQ